MLIVTVAGAPPAAPPSPTLYANRPGGSYAAGLAPPGRFITELGLQGSFAEVDTVAIPFASVRLGVADWMELSLQLPGYSWGPPGARGLTNLAVGAKVGAAPWDWLAWSVVAHVILPTGHRAVADPNPQALGAVNVELYFAEHAWVSLNAELDTFTGALGGREAGVTPSVALGYTLFEAVDPFVQAYFRFAEGEVEPYVGAAVAWLVTPRIQLDVGADYDLAAAAVVVEGGVAVLW